MWYFKSLILSIHDHLDMSYKISFKRRQWLPLPGFILPSLSHYLIPPLIYLRWQKPCHWRNRSLPHLEQFLWPLADQQDPQDRHSSETAATDGAVTQGMHRLSEAYHLPMEDAAPDWFFFSWKLNLRRSTSMSTFEKERKKGTLNYSQNDVWQTKFKENKFLI